MISPIEVQKTSEWHLARQILIQISGTPLSLVQAREKLNLPSKSLSIVSVVEEYRYKGSCVIVVVVLFCCVLCSLPFI